MATEHQQDKVNAKPTSQEWYSRLLKWLFSLDPIEKKTTEPVETMRRTLQLTAKSRYNGSIRLARFSAFSYLTSSVLSLALIFIPLLQLSDLPLAYPERMLNTLQVFFAVAVLLYSVNSNAAQYETRSKSMKECADRIEDLNRKLQNDLYHVRDQTSNLDLQPINKAYLEILAVSENHSRGDHAYAMLQTPEIYHITGFQRLWLTIKIRYGIIESYIFSFILIIAVIIVILDILNITHILTGIFTSSS